MMIINMEKNNNISPKSIIIDGQLHYNFKMFCKGKSLKIGGVVEDLIKTYLFDYKTIQKIVDDNKNKDIIKTMED